MSVKQMGRVWGMDLPQNEKLVLLALADHADHDGGNIHPGIAIIAQKTGYSEREIFRIVKQLLAKGRIAVQESNPGKKTIYCMPPDPCQIDTPDKLSPLTPPTVTPDTTNRGTPDKCRIPPTPPYKEEPSINLSSNRQSVVAKSDDAWLEFCSIYPKRSGSLNKSKAEPKFSKLAREHPDILAGVRRYRKWCDATGKTGTEFVKQMDSWLNGRLWKEDFEVPTDPIHQKTFIDRKNSLMGGLA